MHIRVKYWRASLALVVVVLALTLPTTTAFASANPNPGVLPPQSHPHGLTYGQWSAQWWRWAASFPATDAQGNPANPTTDLTGSLCTLGQSGPFVIRQLWFLAGTFAPGQEVVTRSCTVPTGRTILFPVLNVEWSQVEAAMTPGNCPVPLPPGTPTGTGDATLEACATAQIDVALSQGAKLEADVDGRQVQQLLSYRAVSGAFAITGVPDNPVFPVTGSQPTNTRSAADGFWIMLTPLTPGQHTIHFRADLTTTVFGFLTDVTYHLTIG